MQSVQSHRKDEHVFLAEKFFQEHATAGFGDVRFIRPALPELAVDDVDIRQNIAGQQWQWPVLINAMTGGSPATGKINAELGTIAARTGLAVASGSESILASEPDQAATFTPLRAANPDGIVIANVGADKSPAVAQQAVNALGANMLEVHLNAVQELVMPEGGREFYWINNIARIQAAVSVPVIVKEVGAGMRSDDFARLSRLGVPFVDVGGRGGTDFAQIENVRSHQQHAGDFTDLFTFGQTTVESLLEAQSDDADTLQLWATGGIRSALDVVVALRLGAQVVGIAGLVLHWLTRGDLDTTVTRLQQLLTEVRGIMALLGARNLTELRTVPVVLSPTLRNYIEQRGLTMP
ncbi:type 2 isopentenyl-diphosphate Delta-isomerase [Lacticaseibacillus pantheris]|jgi:isopentenyl-diphosphate delta-isomerase|uniref:Isopentenyl-diphosphate delta-isomerase n=1 Tax=Lacticaseibacillus pantheris DSM 15945 = JCM 12539 = NBRC 106106 TaxID=1423783 RepID=A0A0R1U1Y0_9LACO|nr:type 2 isopentenyl-diphosphate Delta-isomerase [Lacticaseibacillus pantheris]KRL85434.1 isopentenyl-diphosphate delta-isomerase [Lacticaseibacillus pantheris DSM 15945 = JCM 12539 = NBRC 106106]